ncbi:hypothetical protein QVE09_09395 [Paenibacillus sp. ClWae2A]|uniref:hypothetical protein n=1 Tax=Paenibacillus sp. ClWae2A TaxID=3057177 RepID=UPI0028F62050|nr:hypothetical protein [Paenibacillus sp. ClWae2A]MDT9719115.1 hypothetical protein [Paenibacillus sp. ClWae2A]
MAVVAKRFFKGSVSLSEINAYTVPSGTMAMVKAVTLCNQSGAAAKFTMTLGFTNVIYNHEIKANDTVTIPFLDQIMLAGEVIRISCNPTNAIAIVISGKEVT